MTGQNTDTGFTLIPTQVGIDSGWQHISPGYTSSGIKNGQLYIWGQDPLGGSDILVPTQLGVLTDWMDCASDSFTVVAIRNGQLYSYGDNSLNITGQGTQTGTTSTLTQIGVDSDWHKVSLAYEHVLALKIN
jgi:hypothetical protein